MKNGDIVEILTTSKSRVTRDWLDIAKTARAKSKIREALKAERTLKASQGKLLIERLFRKHQFKFIDSNIKKLMHHFKYQVQAEFFHSVAEGQIRLNRELLQKIVLKKAIETPESGEKLANNKPTSTAAKRKNRTKSSLAMITKCPIHSPNAVIQFLVIPYLVLLLLEKA